ncbi:hypothetical protein E2C01_018127 [Portunus trituberculatus]|uniref:Uncharacterized protein n=1 Tax=Portunus trituberculatus TaxID=210409 RepID=A0A5B7DU86_PORTR|nr:hypothetical protein [Portunus trituberculatus]
MHPVTRIPDLEEEIHTGADDGSVPWQTDLPEDTPTPGRLSCKFRDTPPTLTRPPENTGEPERLPKAPDDLCGTPAPPQSTLLKPENLPDELPTRAGKYLRIEFVPGAPPRMGRLSEVDPEPSKVFASTDDLEPPATNLGQKTQKHKRLGTVEACSQRSTRLDTLTPRARLGKGATHVLTPPSPENSVEGPGAAGEGTPLVTSGGAEHGAARNLTPPTTNSRAALGREGVCPPFTPRAKPGREETLRLAPLLPAATTEGPEPKGDWGPLHPASTWGAGTHSLCRPQILKTRNQRQGATRPLTTATNLLAQGASEAGSCWQERFSLEPPDDLARFFSLAQTLLSILHMCLELEKGEVGTFTTPVFGGTHGGPTRHTAGMWV